MALPPDKVLLRWMNFQLKKSGYKKEVTNFSTDLKVKEFFSSFQFHLVRYSIYISILDIPIELYPSFVRSVRIGNG